MMADPSKEKRLDDAIKYVKARIALPLCAEVDEELTMVLRVLERGLTPFELRVQDVLDFLNSLPKEDRQRPVLLALSGGRYVPLVDVKRLTQDSPCDAVVFRSAPESSAKKKREYNSSGLLAYLSGLGSSGGIGNMRLPHDIAYVSVDSTGESICVENDEGEYLTNMGSWVTSADNDNNAPEITSGVFLVRWPDSLGEIWRLED